MAGLELAPAALVSGKAIVGYRQFRSRQSAGPDVGGIVGSLDLGHTLAGFLRCSIQADHNLTQSFSLAEPYITSTQAGGAITARVNREWEITAAAGRQFLDHNNVRVDVMGGAEQLARDAGASVDDMFRYTATVAYRARSATIGLTADYFRFHSTVGDRRFDRFRLVSSVTHRF
jgi:hypothetical protein